MKSANLIFKSFCRAVILLPLLLCSFHSKAQVDDEKVNLYLNLFKNYEYRDFDTAKMYLDSARHFGSQSGDQRIQGKLDLYTGWYFQDISVFDSSRIYFFKSLDHYTTVNDYNKIADVYGNLGNAFIDIGDLKMALDYQMKSLHANEQIILLAKDEEIIETAIKGRAYAWTNISNIYKTLGQHEKAIQFEKKALDYELNEGKDSVGIGISLVNIGSSWDDLGDIDSAIYYTQQAHEIFTREQFSNGLINSNINLYKYHALKGDTILKYLEDALSMCRKFEDKYSEVFVLGYMVSGNFGFSKDSVDRMVDRAKFLLEEYNLKSALYRFYQDEAFYRARIGEYKKAYEAISTYLDYFAERKRDNESVDYGSAELRHEYELQMLEDSLSFSQTLNEQKLKNEKRIGRQRIINTVTIFGFGILGVTLIFVYRSLRVRKENNKKLSDKNAQIEKQKELVEEKNKEITDSITYAKRLQHAILPPVELIHRTFEDAFIYYLPKDVVSGDFYWFEQKGEYTFVAAADCTGHGVPGAMVSVVCSNALNRSVNEFGLTDPAKILNKTRELVISTFTKSGENVKDGMDICLCAFKDKKLIFSGANNPLWIIRKNEYLTMEQKGLKSTFQHDHVSLIEISATKQPVGLYEGMVDFESVEVECFPEDQFYLFTDGYADQFGGGKGKKLKYRNFKKLLVENAHLKSNSQHENLEKFMDAWMKDYEQVDDICIIGVRV